MTLTFVSQQKDMLDWSKPYAEVIGRPGVSFEQDGRNYRQDGSLVTPQPAIPVAPVALPPPVVAAPPAPPVKRPVGRPRNADRFLRAMYSEEPGVFSEDPPVPVRDVLRDYRDPQNADGSMVRESAIYVDGV